MSWFDSSFSFAKTALSQAQKSIDKVLDIKDGPGASQPHSDSGSSAAVVSTKAAVSPPSSTSSDSVALNQAQGSPDSPQKSSSLSTWFSPSQSEPRDKQDKKSQGDQSTPVAEKSSSSAFGSTWGAGDSFWGSYLATPDQGGGEGGGGAKKKKSGSSDEVKKETPKSTPAARSAGTRKSKPSASSSLAKSESSDQRKKVGSLMLSSPPQSSSTPLASTREKRESSETTSTTPAAKRPTSKSSQLSSSTPKSSQNQNKSKKKEKEEDSSKIVNPSERGAKIKTKSVDGGGLRLGKSEREGGGVEATDDSDGVAVVPVVELKSTVTAPAKSGVTGSLSTARTKDNTSAPSPPPPKNSKTNDIEIKNQNSSQVSPTSHNTTPKGNTTHAHTHVQSPSQPSNSKNNSPQTQQCGLQVSDSTDMKQATMEQKTVPVKELKSDTESGTNLETKSNFTVDVDKDVTCASSLVKEKQEEKERGVSLKTTEKKEPSLLDIETPPSTSGPVVTQEVTSEGDSVKSGKGEGGRSELVRGSEHRGESVTSKEEEKDGGSQPQQQQQTDNPDVETLRKELAEIRQVLEVREQKMIEMSRETISLTETNQSLHEELTEAKRMGQTDIEDLRSEFTRRLATTEKKLQAVVKERDSLRKQLQALQNEQTQQSRSAGEELGRLIKEKDEQIAQLMEEGEKLSKQELQSNSIIKKMRQKDKQNDQLLVAQRQQIEDLEGKVKSLKEQVKKKEENESKYQESLGQLNTIAEQQAKELASLKSERDGLLDKVRSLQTNLDNSYKELAELQKANAVTQSVAQEAALSAEQTAREELKSIMEQQKVAAQREKEALLMQVDELRVSVSRAEQQAAWREDHMRQELADMQQRLQEAETRNQELTSSISQATKPLLRQIENLQAAHSAQSNNWDKVEASLTQRLVQTQAHLSHSSEKERCAVEKEMTLQSRVRTLESQLSGTKQEKSQLLASLELERAKLQTLEENQNRESAKTEALRTSFQQSMDELRKEKEMLERQLEYERVRVEAESRKATLESQEKERLKAQLASSLSLNRTISRQSSSGSQSDILEKSLHGSEVGGSVSEMSLHGSRGVASSASLIEQLQSLLKQKEGELANSQNLVVSLERSRGAMAEDLASLSAQQETLKREVDTIPHLLQKLNEVEGKHEAMLQMYGEKAEEAEELKLDIQDLKTMYRQQIEELLNKRRL